MGAFDSNKEHTVKVFKKIKQKTVHKHKSEPSVATTFYVRMSRPHNSQSGYCYKVFFQTFQ